MGLAPQHERKRLARQREVGDAAAPEARSERSRARAQFGVRGRRYLARVRLHRVDNLGEAPGTRLDAAGQIAQLRQQPLEPPRRSVVALGIAPRREGGRLGADHYTVKCRMNSWRTLR